jgi:hypothetical protein
VVNTTNAAMLNSFVLTVNSIAARSARSGSSGVVAAASR